MASWLLSDPSALALPDHCTPQNDYLARFSSTFHTCIPTPLAFISILFGGLSICSWLFAQLPQILKNHKLKSTAGLSIFFLWEWCLGDTTNLLGALLTKQATWQVVIAGYYVVVDVILVGQFFWYSHYKPWRKIKLCERSSDRGPGDDNSLNGVLEGRSSLASSPDRSSSPNSTKAKGDNKPSKPRAIPFNHFRFSRFPSSPGEKGIRSSSNPATHHIHYSPAPSPKTLLFVPVLLAVLANAAPLHPSSSPVTGSSPPKESHAEFIGRLLSWSSTIFYLGSRLPQIYKNHCRRSTAGLSPGLFIAAFFGNFFYSSSILVNPLAWSSCPAYGLHGWAPAEGNDRKTWVLLALPFWLGAAGVLALDAAIGVQFLMFGERRRASLVVQVDDDRGRSHWRHVSGWMRGWMPGPTSPRRREVEQEEEDRLLVDATTEDGGRQGRKYDTI